jgi:hypothetical protein
LSLILMYSFDVYIEHGVLIYIDIASPLHPLNESMFVYLFDVGPLSLELRVIGVTF